jgi:hypothetical protein
MVKILSKKYPPILFHRASMLCSVHVKAGLAIKKPAQKNPPNKTQKTPPKKTHLKVVFFGFYWVV